MKYSVGPVIIGTIISKVANLFVEGIKNLEIADKAFGIRGASVTLVCFVSTEIKLPITWFVI